MSPQPQPSGVYQKPNEKWTFDIFPNGIRREIGEYAERVHAEQDLGRALHHWNVNGQDYGTVNAITDQGPIVVAQ